MLYINVNNVILYINEELAILNTLQLDEIILGCLVGTRSVFFPYSSHTLDTIDVQVKVYIKLNISKHTKNYSFLR